MFPLLGGLASGVGSLIGSMMTNSQSATNQQQMEAYNTQMSNTAYQRASTDMKAAGLNPMMMAAGGMSASTPNAPGIALQNPGNSVATGINTGVQMKLADATVDKMAQEVAASRTDQVRTAADTELLKSKNVTEQAMPVNVRSETDLRDVLSRIGRSDAVIRANSAVSATNESSLPSWLRSTLDTGAFVGSKLSKAIEPVTDLVSSAGGVRRFLSH